VTTIVRAGTEHLDIVHPLFCDYRAFYNLERKEDAAREFLTARLERQDSAILLAIDEITRGAAGFAQLYPVFSSLHMAPAWILNDLFVRPAFRRHGVAHELLDAANHLARDTGAAQLELATGNDNMAAQTLYESRGWKRDTDFMHYSLELE